MADRVPLIGMLDAVQPNQPVQAPLASMPAFNQPFGELSVPHYTPSQRIGNAAQDVLQWLGAQPHVARHLVEGMGGVLGMTPAAVPVAAADAIDANARGNKLGTAQAMAGMIPGVGPEAKAAWSELRAQVAESRAAAKALETALRSPIAEAPSNRFAGKSDEEVADIMRQMLSGGK